MRGTIPTNWDENDAFSGWRKVLARMQRAGARKQMKQQYHRRVRREWRRKRRNDEVA